MNTLSSFNSTRSPIFVWLIWVIATTIGLALGGMIAIGIGWSAGEAARNALGAFAGYLVAGIFFGIALGGIPAAAQALVLGPQIHAGRWIGGAIFGGALAMAVALAVIAPNAETLPGWLNGLIAGTLLGLGVGAAQWVVIRDRLHHAALWIPICVATFVLGLLVLFTTGGEGREFVSLTLSGLVIGGLSGAGMLWLLRQSR